MQTQTVGIADRIYALTTKRRGLIAQRAVCLDIMEDMRSKIAAGSTIWVNMLAEYERTMPHFEGEIARLEARLAALQ